MSFLGNKKRQLQESAWLLGICPKGFDDLKSESVQWISNGVYEGRKWFADPFILDCNDDVIHLLVEEFDYKVHRGRIAKLTIDRSSWTVVECLILLDLSTHLSFPMIWRENGEVFVCPENYLSGGWSLYRYNSKQERLEFVSQLLNERLTDATLFHYEGSYWLLSTIHPRPNGNVLTIWKGNSFKGPFNVFQHISFDENIGRNAGAVFEYNGRLIRPAQESNFTYGHSISFQEVGFSDGQFAFNEFFRFSSPHRKYDSGTHTFNTYDGMAVLDVKGWRYPLWGRLIAFLSKIAVALHLKKPYTIQ